MGIGDIEVMLGWYGIDSSCYYDIDRQRLIYEQVIEDVKKEINKFTTNFTNAVSSSSKIRNGLQGDSGSAEGEWMTDFDASLKDVCENEDSLKKHLVEEEGDAVEALLRIQNTHSSLLKDLANEENSIRECLNYEIEEQKIRDREARERMKKNHS